MKKIKLKKKKSFIEEFWNNSPGLMLIFILLIATFIYFIVSAIVGNLILPTLPIFTNELMNANFATKTKYGALIIVAIILLPLFIFLFIYEIISFITYIIALKRYTYLPFTTDEVRELIKEGIIENNPDSYIDYLTKEVSYFDGTIYFSKDDFKSIIFTCFKIWGKPITLNKDYLIRNKINKEYLIPFYKNDEKRLMCFNDLKTGHILTLF